jgi:predicted metal-dependent hydrolase
MKCLRSVLLSAILWGMSILIDRLVRSRRRSIALIIQRDGTLEVRAPLRTPITQVQQLVDEKADWIRKRRAKMAAFPIPAQHLFNEGEHFLYLGRQYPLVLVNQAMRPALQLDGHFYLAQTAQDRARALFTAWYKAMAREVIEERVRYFAARHGFTYNQVKITSARTRWGSCTAKGTLSFTWRLVLAPLEMIDYVVVHELVHTVERSHRKVFWAKVQAIMPDYLQRRQWLNGNGGTLMV